MPCTEAAEICARKGSIAGAVTVLRNFAFTDELVGRRFVGYEINGDFGKLSEQKIGNIKRSRKHPLMMITRSINAVRGWATLWTAIQPSPRPPGAPIILPPTRTPLDAPEVFSSAIRKKLR